MYILRGPNDAIVYTYKMCLMVSGKVVNHISKSKPLKLLKSLYFVKIRFNQNSNKNVEFKNFELLKLMKCYFVNTICIKYEFTINLSIQVYKSCIIMLSIEVLIIAFIQIERRMTHCNF